MLISVLVVVATRRLNQANRAKRGKDGGLSSMGGSSHLIDAHSPLGGGGQRVPSSTSSSDDIAGEFSHELQDGSLDAWFLEAECIQIDSLIAVGSSAKVFKGGYKGMTIAVKKILVRYGTHSNKTCDWEGVGRVCVGGWVCIMKKRVYIR